MHMPFEEAGAARMSLPALRKVKWDIFIVKKREGSYGSKSVFRVEQCVGGCRVVVTEVKCCMQGCTQPVCASVPFAGRG